MSYAEEQRNYIDIVELAARTGLSISTINRLKKRGKIPFYQPGGRRARVLFPPNAIEGTVSSQTSPDATLPHSEPGDVELNHEDSPESDVLLSPSSESSRLRGPMPRWRRNAN